MTSAEMSVTVVLPTVDLQLEFDPTSLTIAVGRDRTATLSLLDVPAGAAVTVALAVTNATTAQVVEPSGTVVFDVATMDHRVTVAGMAEGSVTVTATATELIGLSEASTVASAELAVTVVDELPGLRLRVRALLEGPLQ